MVDWVETDVIDFDEVLVLLGCWERCRLCEFQALREGVVDYGGVLPGAHGLWLGHLGGCGLVGLYGVLCRCEGILELLI